MGGCGDGLGVRYGRSGQTGRLEIVADAVWEELLVIACECDIRMGCDYNH